MIPVYQERFGWGEGDCVWATLASIFEIPYPEMGTERIASPHYSDVRKWTECRFPYLEYHYEDWSVNYRLVPGPSIPEHPSPTRWAYDVPDEFEPPVEGYWMGTIHSLSLRAPLESAYYGMPGLHAVVMKGRKLVHDPNPHNVHEKPPQLVMASWWTER